MKSFNVIWYDVNRDKFEPYDIMPYLTERYKSKSKSDKPKTFDELKQFIKKESMYMWWSRCEYEIILADWPSQKHNEKWDIHQQVMMNLDTITTLLMENLKVKAGD